MATRKEKNWLPLEANPDILTEYCRKLGLPETVGFHDILSTESWALDMLPNPVYSIVLLFPISPASELERAATSPTDFSAECSYFMTQKVGNACGTIAVLHAMLNLHADMTLESLPFSYVSRMYESTKSLSPTERGDWLEADVEIESAHQATESLGQSMAPSDTEVDTHFIAFVLGNDGKTVLELDGRRPGPVVRGLCDDKNEFPEKVLDIIKTEFMDRNPGDIRFSLLGLA